MLKFDIIDIIDSSIAISPSKAVILYNHFKGILESGKKAQYSFKGLEDCSSAFCNAAIGKIYMDFGKKVKSSISFSGYDNENEIWAEKVKNATQLGLQENYRNKRQQTLEEIIS